MQHSKRAKTISLTQTYASKAFYTIVSHSIFVGEASLSGVYKFQETLNAKASE